MQNLIIIGAGGHGLVIAEIAELSGYSVAFYDDNPAQVNSSFDRFKVKKRINQLPPRSNIIIGIGDNLIRRQISIDYSGANFVSLCHPNSIVSNGSKIGVGTVITAGAYVNTGVRIGNHCIVNTAAVVDHDSSLADFVHISPNATLCGNVKIGEASWIGAGAIIINGVDIGKNVIVGAGAVVIDNIPDGAVVVGNPAKLIKMLTK